VSTRRVAHEHAGRQELRERVRGLEPSLEIRGAASQSAYPRTRATKMPWSGERRALRPRPDGAQDFNAIARAPRRRGVVFGPPEPRRQPKPMGRRRTLVRSTKHGNSLCWTEHPSSVALPLRGAIAAAWQRLSPRYNNRSTTSNSRLAPHATPHIDIAVASVMASEVCGNVMAGGDGSGTAAVASGPSCAATARTASCRARQRVERGSRPQLASSKLDGLSHRRLIRPLFRVAKFVHNRAPV
jgi:hypothetical protein